LILLLANIDMRKGGNVHYNQRHLHVVSILFKLLISIILFSRTLTRIACHFINRRNKIHQGARLQG
jgi:hypothetical protein